MPKKAIAVDVVTIRAARSESREGKTEPLIISIPKEIADAAKLQKGEKVRIYTDGHKVYIDRLEEPEL